MSGLLVTRTCAVASTTCADMKASHHSGKASTTNLLNGGTSDKASAACLASKRRTRTRVDAATTRLIAARLERLNLAKHADIQDLVAGQRPKAESCAAVAGTPAREESATLGPPRVAKRPTARHMTRGGAARTSDTGLSTPDRVRPRPERASAQLTAHLPSPAGPTQHRGRRED